jgi:hypothetical protein
MKPLCLTVVGLVCTIAATADAESLSAARPHAAKKSTLEASKSASFVGIGFSDPYGSPVHVRKTMIAQFPPIRTGPPAEPQGGFSLTAGRDAPDAPFTGGFKLRF